MPARPTQNDLLRYSLSYIVLVVAVLVSLFPIYWMITTSFKIAKQAFAATPVWFFRPTLQNFRMVLLERNLPKFLANSFIVTIFSTFLTLFLAGNISYAVSRYKVPGSKNLLFWILSLRMIPPIVAAVPIYLLMQKLGLLDTHLVLVLIYTFMNLPLAVWLIKGFLEDIPLELEESAMVDGCSRLQAFIRIALPLIIPGMIATGMICMIFAWNEFLFANILTGFLAKTAPVALTAYATPVGILWGQIFAAGTILIVPVTIIGLVFQRYLVRGLTFGALKA